MVHQEPTGKSEADCVNSVTQVRADVTRDGETGARECPVGMVNCLDRNDIVVLAVNQQDRRPRGEVCG